MESRRKRARITALRWTMYGLMLLVFAALQSTPGLFAVGAFKPCYILAICLAVSLCEGEYYGALYGVAGGLLWDYIAGRTVGMLALCLMFLCFFASVLVQLYLKASKLNFILLNFAAGWLLLSTDFLFYYLMPGYAGAGMRYLTVVLPEAAVSAVISPVFLWMARRIQARFPIPE
jgi:rod shape-determining protein MreD